MPESRERRRNPKSESRIAKPEEIRSRARPPAQAAILRKAAWPERRRGDQNRRLAPDSQRREAWRYRLANSTKFFSNCRPTVWLFSGWNCVAKTLSRQTEEANVSP